MWNESFFSAPQLERDPLDGPHSSLTNLRLTATQWEAEDRALKRGADPQPCPRCARRGFYAPRFAPPWRRYRACKFCGFWQEMGRPPHKIIRYECVRPDHRYADWKEPQEWWTCPACQSRYSPAQSVPWPVHNRAHPWHEAPRRGTQRTYIDYWLAKGVKQAPVFGIP